MATTQLAARPPSMAPAAAGPRPVEAVPAAPGRVLSRWPLFLIAAPAAVAVWSGWVGLGLMCGFGPIHPLPGIADHFTINTAITLPVGVEAYGAYAMGAWLHPATPPNVRKFARNSALGSLALGMVGQVIYHLLNAAHTAAAPWPVVMLVSCLPVLTLGFGGALTHLLRGGHAAPPRVAVDEPDTAAAIADDLRTEIASVRSALRTDLRTEIASVRTELRKEIASVRPPLPEPPADDADAPAVDRDALVAELADEMRDAVTSGDRWTPDYDALMERTGFRRSWCEKAVRDARTQAFSGPPETPFAAVPRLRRIRTGDDPYGPESRTDDPSDTPERRESEAS